MPVQKKSLETYWRHHVCLGYCKHCIITWSDDLIGKKLTSMSILNLNKYIYIYICISYYVYLPTPTQVECDKKSIFNGSLTGLNSTFFFS